MTGFSTTSKQKMNFQLSQQQWHNNILHKDTNKSNIFAMVPYSKGLSESFRNMCGKAGVEVHFKGANTVKELLIAAEDKDSIYDKGGVIYRYRCDQPRCTLKYIDETGRNFGKRNKVHFRAPSLIFNHSQTTRYIMKLGNFSIVGREPQGITRTIKEVM